MEPRVPSRWTTAYLDSMRHQGDPLADGCLAALRQEQAIEHSSTLFKWLADNQDTLPADAPPAFRDFLAATHQLPAHADKERLKRGEEIFMTHAFPIALVLLAKSLPAGYAAPNLTKILCLSGDLEQHPYKRTLGVLQMLVNVASVGGFEANGGAMITAQKLRLLHAGVRQIVRRRLPDYEATYGVPVNQEDMLATLMGFSYLVIEGLRQLPASLSTREEDDLFYLWQLFAYLMGIHPEAIPRDIADAAAFYTAYAERHYVAAQDNPEGVKLAAADLRMMQQMLPRTLRCLGFSVIPRIYTVDLLGHAGCARVGIKAVFGHTLLKRLLRCLPVFWMRGWQAGDDVNRPLHETLSRLVFQGMINRQYGGEVTFLIPRRLADLRQLA